MLLREKLVRAEEASAAMGIREVGGNNHGPWMRKFLAEVGCPEGLPWCDAYQSFEEHAVAGHRLPIESASVAQTYAVARSLGWVVGPGMSPKLYPTPDDRDPRPKRGDLVLYDFDGDGQTDDHIGIVRSRVVIPGGYELHTVEGNTGDGSAADGDGVYLRERQVRRGAVAFVRIPGTVPDEVAKQAATVRAKAAKSKPKPKSEPTLKQGAAGGAVGTLQHALNKHGAGVQVDCRFGPATTAAVAHFQAAHKLAADGVVGPRTWAALKEA